MNVYLRLVTALIVLACQLLLPIPAGLSQQARPVDLELVLAVDTSTSVDEAEFELQQQGLAKAFTHRDVIRAIRATGNLGIAVSLVQWSGQARQRTVVDWMLINSEAGAAEFAQRIRNSPRTLDGMTDISGAIHHSVASIERNSYLGQRRVIDISGDGSSDPQASRAARDGAVKSGVTINGLVIYNDDIDLAELANIEVLDHYSKYVIGGPGAFIVTAASFAGFERAIRQKLVREIIGPATAKLNGAITNVFSGSNETNRQ